MSEHLPSPSGEPSLDKLEVPRFSIAERDRRWSNTRKLMDRDNLDVLVIPGNSGGWDQMQPGSRYLTGLGGNCATISVVFTRDEVTALAPPVPTKEYWLRYQDWVTDVRPNFFSMSASLIERMKELRLERARIGIVGLEGIMRNPEGCVPYGTYVKIQETFPEATLVNATHILDEVRFVKSAEEIEFLRKAVELVEEGIRTLEREAKPGTRECQVYARMLASMYERGGDMPSMLLWACGNPQPFTNASMPTQRKMAKGDVISAEIEAKWGGYIGQQTQYAVLGKAPAEYHDMFAVQQECLARAYEHLRPGISAGEFLQIAEDTGKSSKYECRMILHGRGLGGDQPLIVFGSRDPRMKNWKMEENAVVILKPMVGSSGWTNAFFLADQMALNQDPRRRALGVKNVCWGDSVVVTAQGAKRLGTRQPSILEID